jgi:hypothetical protein
MITYASPTLVRHGDVVRQTRAITSGVSLDNTGKARDTAESANDATLSIPAVGETTSTNADDS